MFDISLHKLQLAIYPKQISRFSHAIGVNFSTGNTAAAREYVCAPNNVQKDFTTTTTIHRELAHVTSRKFPPRIYLLPVLGAKHRLLQPSDSGTSSTTLLDFGALILVVGLQNNN